MMAIEVNLMKNLVAVLIGVALLSILCTLMMRAESGNLISGIINSKSWGVLEQTVSNSSSEEATGTQGFDLSK